MRPRASDEIADRLRAHIQDEGLEPGDRLGKEEELARRFGVSRPTVREAIRTLSSAHIVTAAKGRGGGIFVSATPEQGIGRSVTAAVATLLETNAFSIEELLETRVLLEVPLAGLAAQHAGPEEIAELDALVREAASDGDVLELDARVHRTIARIAGNRLAGALSEWITDVLLAPLHRLVEPAVVDVVIVDQHQALLRAIERGDPSAAERAMREHLTYLRDLVEAVRRAGRG
jgi:GntR family transcriptional regulator, transcriptional repressor for pyruvate dehydrogenase complex